MNGQNFSKIWRKRKSQDSLKQFTIIFTQKANYGVLVLEKKKDRSESLQYTSYILNGPEGNTETKFKQNMDLMKCIHKFI